jgi:Dolichyl-phosphate-mannose-protein mannosyltransferase
VHHGRGMMPGRLGAMASARASSRPSYAWLPLAAIGLGVCALLLLLANRYGFHRDELYFIVAGQHPDWGYVDQPPFTPLTSAGAVAILGLSPLAVRVLPALATVAVIGLTAAMTREFGGGTRAQLLAAAFAAASAIIGLGHLDSTTTYDMLAWAAVSWLVIRILRGADARTWLAVGVVAGVGLQNKNLVVLLGIALVIGLLLARRWEVFRSGWLWGGLGLAGLIWLPNLVWQSQNGFPQLEMSAAVASRSSWGDVIATIPLQLILAGPLLFPMFVAGLWWLLRNPVAQPWRAIGWAYLAALAVTMLLRGQVYYATGLFPAIFAASGMVADGWLARGRTRLRAVTLSVAGVASAALVAVLTLPLLPPATLAQTPIPGIYNPSAEQIGWEELVDTVEGVVDGLSAEDRARAAIVTANYGEAGALTLLGSPDLPPVYSGHNSFAWWGPPPDERNLAIIVAHWDPAAFAADFGSCERRATIGNAAGVENEEVGAGVWVCSNPPRTWSELWEKLSFYS